MMYAPEEVTGFPGMAEVGFTVQQVGFTVQDSVFHDTVLRVPFWQGGAGQQHVTTCTHILIGIRYSSAC